MAGGISINIQGLDKVLAAIDTYGNNVQQGVDDVLTANAADIVTEAKTLAPIDDSNLRQNIGFEDKSLQKNIYSNANYSAYVEFGTGSKVDVPVIEGMDLPAYALTFFVNGQGRMPPHPFFFPAVQAGSLRIVGQIEKVLSKGK